MERMPLQEWFNTQNVPDEMLWKEAWRAQVVFVRDSLTYLVGAGMSYEDRQQIATVISTHRSKSIDLPVYELARPGLRFILRGNFYNWKVSVLSEQPVEVDLTGLCHTTPPIEPDYTGNELSPVYFEGFPPELIFSYYEPSDKHRFSMELSSERSLWTALFLIQRALGHVRAYQWHTRESHRAELAAERAAREAAAAAEAQKASGRLIAVKVEAKP